MDQECYDILFELDLPDICLIVLEDFEDGDEELVNAKQNRTRIEYYFTCTPSLPLFILNNYPQVDIITYLDSDLYFFADPTPVYAEMADYSIAIIEHRFLPQLRHAEKWGIYNVGWLSFRRDESALACLGWWRERCIEWCYDRYEGNRFADQKYLDDWPRLFNRVVVLQHKGANLAPWNLGNYKIHIDKGQIWVDEQPLIFFHFHRLKQIAGWLYNPGLVGYKVKPFKVLQQYIYAPYIRTLVDITQKTLPSVAQVDLSGSVRHKNVRTQSFLLISVLRHIARKIRNLLRICRGIFAREYIFFMNGDVII
ncbi:MAG: glycosyl transferase [Chloroflexi bacterium]|nr:glycosyl transferase [Chloroflexota bacterium]